MNDRVSPLWGALGGLLIAGFILLGGDGCGGRTIGLVCRFLYDTLGISVFIRAFPIVSTLTLVAIGTGLGWVGRQVRPD